jgi:hypothetical protein
MDKRETSSAINYLHCPCIYTMCRLDVEWDRSITLRLRYITVGLRYSEFIVPQTGKYPIRLGNDGIKCVSLVPEHGRKLE